MAQGGVCHVEAAGHRGSGFFGREAAAVAPMPRFPSKNRDFVSATKPDDICKTAPMSFWNDRATLVTGGASFIGSHLVEHLVQLGADVRVADDFSSGRHENLSSVDGAVEVLTGDLREREFADRACQDIDIVFHLAAAHGGRGYISTHPVECSLNMVMDGVVFAAAHHAGVDRICFASSACVYPTTLQDGRDPSKVVYLSEDLASLDTPGRAFADEEYGWTKLMGEMALQAYTRQYGVKTVPCRIFTAYGERENETHAVVAWIARAFVAQDPFVVWGTGEQDRNFTYVGDVVEGLARAAERVTDGTPVNIGTAEHIKVIDAVRLVLELTGVDTTIEFDPSRPVGVFSRAADLTQTRRLLGWEPRTAFEDGLRRTIEWYFSTHDRDKVSANLENLLTERSSLDVALGPAP
jgi:nucleoside-diphosphate-sugar epimerase